MKKTIIFTICAVLLLPLFSIPANAAFTSALEVDAEIAYLVSLDDGSVIYDKDSVRQVPIASMTKIITAILTIENCSDFNETVTASESAIRALDGTNSSNAGILVGEQLTVTQLLYCMLIYSANDAANILAEYTAGNIPDFVVLMNEFAVSLGCKNTHFANPHGLDEEGHWSTARDMAVIYAYCLKNDTFREIVSTTYYEIPPTNKYREIRYLHSTNKMLNTGYDDYYYPNIANGKTGTTEEAGYCFISSAKRDGYSYICVIIRDAQYDCDGDGVDENIAFIDTKKLYTWTFDNISLRIIADSNKSVGETAVAYGKDYDYVTLVPAAQVTALVPGGVGENGVTFVLIDQMTPKDIEAPVKKGTVLGRASIQYAGEEITQVDLVAAFDVEKSMSSYLAAKTLGFLKSKAFLASVGIAVAVLLPLCVVAFWVIPVQRRRKANIVRIVKGYDVYSDEMEKGNKKK